MLICEICSQVLVGQEIRFCEDCLITFWEQEDEYFDFKTCQMREMTFEQLEAIGSFILAPTMPVEMTGYGTLSLKL